MSKNNEKLVLDIQAGINVKENMETLWTENKGLVEKVVLKYKGIAELDDIRQECYIIMVKAVKSYNQDFECKFSTWFLQIAPHYIVRYINTNCYTIRLPERVQADIWRYKRAVSNHVKELGKFPANTDIAEALGCTLKHVKAIEHYLTVNDVSSLDEPIKASEDESLTVGDAIPCDTDYIEEFAKVYDHKIMSADLKKALAETAPEYSAALKKRYLEGNTCEEIGSELGVSSQAISERCKKGMDKIKNSTHAPNLKKYYEIYLKASPITHVGLAQYKRTWTSEQEQYILRKERKEEELAQRRQEREANKFMDKVERLWEINPDQAKKEWMDRVSELLSVE